MLHNDDTPVKILSLIKENEQDPERKRTGMYTTGIVSLLGDLKIILFFSGRQHAGENLDDVLEHRAEELGKAIQMLGGRLGTLFQPVKPKDLKPFGVTASLMPFVSLKKSKITGLMSVRLPWNSLGMSTKLIELLKK